jgi:pyruvate dehydrogenase E2 component (dihydrolipoamide acetyltransferase)
MEEGTILAWLKQVGEEVALGEELVEIETDKANMAYESDAAGTLLEILAQEGETVALGAPIARIGDGEGPGAQGAGPVAAGDSSSSQAAGEGSRVKASPLARRLAKERGLDLSAVQGSGPGGRIVKADVISAVSPAGGVVVGDPRGAEESKTPSTVGVSTTTGPAGQTAKGDVTIQEPTKLQQVVARRMAESKATAPHFYLSAEVDMSAAVQARARLKEIAAEGDVVPSFNDMAVKASALALREFPRANGAYRDGRFELYSRVNVGIAVAAEEALVVPTVFDADRKGLREIATDARRIAARVRSGEITPPELSGATFTVSNLGMYGVRGFGAVINSPQAAILAVGEIAERPTLREGEIVAAPLMEMTLACDHRILYGADGARFLARVRALLEAPIGLAL